MPSTASAVAMPARRRSGSTPKFALLHTSAKSNSSPHAWRAARQVCTTVSRCLRVGAGSTTRRTPRYSCPSSVGSTLFVRPYTVTWCPRTARRTASCSAKVSKPPYAAGMPRVPRIAMRRGLACALSSRADGALRSSMRASSVPPDLRSAKTSHAGVARRGLSLVGGVRMSMDAPTLGQIREGLARLEYFTTSRVETAIFLAVKLGKPLLAEGPAGAGKTEIGKVLAQLLDTELVRLQCYEGLDEARALYEWNYQKQLLRIQSDQAERRPWSEVSEHIFSREYLLERPLLRAISAPRRVVLLIDEI